MTHFAPHLQQGDIVNPFPGLTRLEATLGHPITTRIGSNESMAIEGHPLEQGLAELAALARYYPDPYAYALRERAAALCHVTPHEVLFDAGADSLLHLFLRLRCQAGDTVITTAGTYPTFKYFAQGLGLNLIEVPYHDEGSTLTHALEALAESAHTHRAALVYLANPDNPTGSYHPITAIQAFRAALPPETFLLLDEAYIDFCTEAHETGCLDHSARIRTLSKAYGLAGLRIGYAIAPADIIAKADQIRIQFALSSPAQRAAQLVFDTPTLAPRLIAQTIALRTQLADGLRTQGCDVLPSETNFVTIRYASAEQAAAVQRSLWSAQTAVHRPPHPAVQHLIRVTAHPDALSPSVIAALSPP